MQLNCYPPPGDYCQTSQVNWFQYLVIAQGRNLAYQIRAQLGGMRQIRDLGLAHTPAAQWLIEILDRHSADLALLVTSDAGDLASTARDLVRKAVHTARRIRVFDDATVDDALEFLGQASCKLPPSMLGVGTACATYSGRFAAERLRTD